MDLTLLSLSVTVFEFSLSLSACSIARTGCLIGLNGPNATIFEY